MEKLYIDDIETCYLISNKGRLLNTKTNKINNGWRTSKGYIKVGLIINGKYKGFNLHRLVAKHFIDNPLNKKEVNHINGKKDCNHKFNLEWVTRQENQKHAIKIGLWDKYMANPRKGVEHTNAKYSENNIRLICELIEQGYDNKYIRNNVGFKMYKKLPSDIRTRKRWKHISKEYNW